MLLLVNGYYIYVITILKGLFMTDLVESIKTAKVEGGSRVVLVPLVLGGAAPFFENTLYALSEKLVDGYSGGYWDIHDLTQSGRAVGFFFVPTGFGESVVVRSLGFQQDVVTTARAAGVALTLMALSNLSLFLASKGQMGLAQKCGDAFHELRDFISFGLEFTDAERSEINLIID